MEQRKIRVIRFGGGQSIMVFQKTISNLEEFLIAISMTLRVLAIMCFPLIKRKHTGFFEIIHGL